MNPDEYANLDRIEQTHWYYSGKREFVRAWIERIRPLAKDHTLLDCGAGTGRFALELSDRCRVLVLDDHEESLRYLRTRFPPERVINLEANGRIPLPDASLDCVTALDVLEHTPDDKAVAAEFARLLKPGGLAVVTVPASMALWSDWDVSLHHYRRYSREQLRGAFPAADWTIEYLNYTNVAVFPAVWAMRKWRACFPARSSAVRAEDKMPSPWMNRLLKFVFVRMAFWKFPLPIGVSLLLVAKRR